MLLKCDFFKKNEVFIIHIGNYILLQLIKLSAYNKKFRSQFRMCVVHNFSKLFGVVALRINTFSLV